MQIKSYKNYFYLYLLVSITYVVYCLNLPLSIYTTAMHDDALFWTRAYEFLKGNWLGHYNQLTLAKGPTFSFLLAINAVVGIPISLTLGFINLLSNLYMAKVLNKLDLKPILAFIAFLLVLFHPALVPIRVIRDDIYTPLTLACFFGLIDVLYFSSQKNQLKKPLIVGMLFALFWMCREEGVWVIPGFAFLSALYFLKCDPKDRVAACKRLTLIGVSFFAVILLVSSINYQKYSFFGITDFKAKGFESALSSIQNVDIGEQIRFLPASQRKRAEIYKVSPSFNELKNYFEVKGKGWTKHGCKDYPQTCGDYASGWFMWALRDAVADRGYYSNGKVAEDFYLKINSEIEAACNMKKITCNSGFLPFMPDPPKDFLNLFLKALGVAVNTTIDTADLDGDKGYSGPSGDLLELVKLFLRGPYVLPASDQIGVIISGWVYSEAGKLPSFECLSNGARIKKTIDWKASEDIAAYFKDDKAINNRFTTKVNPENECVFGFNGTTVALNKFLDQGVRDYSENGNAVHIDTAIKSAVLPIDSRVVKSYLAKFYTYLSKILVCLGVISFLIVIFKNTYHVFNSKFLLISLSLYILYFSRVALIALIDVTSFSAINSLYLMPAYLLLVLASLLSICTLFQSINMEELKKFFRIKI